MNGQKLCGGRACELQGLLLLLLLLLPGSLTSAAVGEPAVQKGDVRTTIDQIVFQRVAILGTTLLAHGAKVPGSGALLVRSYFKSSRHKDSKNALLLEFN
jgi:hypothetical protein